MILPITTSTIYGLNSFGHMMSVLQTSMYQNIAKLLTNLSNFYVTGLVCFGLYILEQS